jgi:hypothetical protein
MSGDPGIFLRLKASLDSTIQGVEEKSFAVKALTDAYAVFRSEAERVAEQEHALDEFKRLFPPPPEVSAPSARGGFDPIVAGGSSAEALSLLARLSGWLDGFVQSIRMQAEADAYARERVRHESSQ